MILAGIDEAGYGPLLGPLVVGCSAFQLPDAPSPTEIPCLWKALQRIVSKKRSAGGNKLHINDSKVVYSPSGGLKELERSVLAIARTIHGQCENLTAFLAQTAAHATQDIAGYSWYQAPGDEAFPLAQDAFSVGIPANALAVEMRRAEISCVHLAARLVCERQLNAMMNATRNKANTLFSITAIHLDHLLRHFGQQNLFIVCDRQGGRMHYGSLLRMMFEDWALTVLQESDERSDYRLTQGKYSVRILFSEKAEEKCLSVAAAAMLSKYLREAMMARFNAFWASHLPQVAPTAGYYTDGVRFLRDIEPKRQELRIADGELIRCR